MTLSLNSIVTPQNPRGLAVQVPLTAVASYNTDAPTNTAGIIVPVAFNGARAVVLRVEPRDTTVAGRILLFKSADNGTTKRLITSRDVAAYTWSSTAGPSATQKVDFGLSDDNPSLMGGNGSSVTETFYIGCTTTQTGGGFIAYAEWADY